MGPFEDKILEFDTISQNRIGSRFLGVPRDGLHHDEKSFGSWWDLFI